MTIAFAIAELRGWVGRSGRASDPIHRAEWARILLPNDNYEWAQRYLEAKGSAHPTSTCALVAKAFLRSGGCTCVEHGAYQPRMGSAVADIERIARRHGAWLTSSASLSTYPSPGDIVCVDLGNEHVLTVVDSRAEDGSVMSVDGGQRDSTFTLARARRMTPTATGATLTDLTDGVSSRPGYVRTIYARASGQIILGNLDRCE